jgi:hypothetical protein
MSQPAGWLTKTTSPILVGVLAEKCHPSKNLPVSPNNPKGLVD